MKLKLFMKKTLILHHNLNTRCLLILFLIMGCTQKHEDISFGKALENLQTIQSLEVLQSGNAMIAVSGTYQGRVFTSSSNGLEGKSYGWINWDLISNKKHQTTMARLGGESRVWFGPEFGKYAIFFEPNKIQDDENIKVPEDLNSKQFTKVISSKKSITYQADMQILNANNFKFKINTKRKITILDRETIAVDLKTPTSSDISVVGFSAETWLKNIDSIQWTKEQGLLSVWELGCMLSSPDTKVIIPLEKPLNSLKTYFGINEESRYRINNNTLFYKSDAQLLGKIGIPPESTKNIMGSYSHKNNLLTIVTFNFKNDGVYLNCFPKNTAPYDGDAINIFNGEINESLGYNWPFYEFESLSSSKELKPLEELYHKQTIYHIEGGYDLLNSISKTLLGVNLNEIPKF